MSFATPIRHPFGILDAGSGKIVCLIAEPTPQGLRVLGLGLQRSRGIKSGIVVDLDEAELAIRAAVSQAEQAAGVNLTSLYASVACGRLKSQSFAATADISGPSVSATDVQRLMQGARAYAERDGRMALHVNPIAVDLDRAPGPLDPTGMAARTMRAEVHAVTADSAPVRNLMLVLDRCHLAVAGLYAAPLASALAATTPDERQEGVTVIDIGAGTTKLAAFKGGQLIDVALIPMGAALFTSDIAHGLHMPLNEAERIKIIHGSVVSAQSDQHDVFSYPQAGPEGRMQQATRAQLGLLLRQRAADLLVTLMNRASPGLRRDPAASTLVLTGGASQLAGLPEFASSVLNCPVRLGRVPAIAGLSQPMLTPALAPAIGIAMAAEGAFRDTALQLDELPRGSYARQVGEWLKGGF